MASQRPVSALCSRWLTMRRMGEDAPKLPLRRADAVDLDAVTRISTAAARFALALAR